MDKNLFFCARRDEFNLAEIASKEAHDFAKKKGYSDWWDWYHKVQEKDPEMFSTETEPMKYLIKLTNRYNKQLWASRKENKNSGPDVATIFSDYYETNP